MTIPTWILGIFAAIMLAVAAISIARLALARSGLRPGADTDADIDVAHLLMGIAMAGMLLASLQTLPTAAWAVIFGVMTAWFGWCVFRESRTQGARVLADGHHAPHLVHSAAMLYMFAAITGPARGGSGMAGPGSSAGSATGTLRLPLIALVFALLLAGYAVLDLDRLSGPAAHGSPAVRQGYVPGGVALVGAPAGGPGQLTMTGQLAGGSAAGPASEITMLVPGASADEAAYPGITVGRGTGSGLARGLLLSPRTAAGCRIAMGVTMAFMLVIMI
jgi:hypothetical protein